MINSRQLARVRSAASNTLLVLAEFQRKTNTRRSRSQCVFWMWTCCCLGAREKGVGLAGDTGLDSARLIDAPSGSTTPACHDQS